MTVVGIRLAYLAGAALALLWAQGHVVMHAYGALGDLVFGVFGRWDAGWFVRIATHGYDTKQSAAFFPLYPLVVRGLAFVVRSHLAAGVLVSLASAAGAAILLYRLARSRDAVLLLALYPIAYVFTAAYSDALEDFGDT